MQQRAECEPHAHVEGCPEFWRCERRVEDGALGVVEARHAECCERHDEQHAQPHVVVERAEVDEEAALLRPPHRDLRRLVPERRREVDHRVAQRRDRELAEREVDLLRQDGRRDVVKRRDAGSEGDGGRRQVHGGGGERWEVGKAARGGEWGRRRDAGSEGEEGTDTKPGPSFRLYGLHFTGMLDERRSALSCKPCGTHVSVDHAHHAVPRAVRLRRAPLAVRGLDEAVPAGRTAAQTPRQRARRNIDSRDIT